MTPPPLVFSREGVRRVDRAAIEEFGIPGIVLMEHAAIALEREAIRLLAGRAGAALLLCGSGNNGGDGLALARLLSNAGWRVHVALAADESRVGGDAGINLRIVRAMGAPMTLVGDRPERALDAIVAREGPPALIVDALLGTGADRPLEARMAAQVEWINARRAADFALRVLAADIPTGLDCDSGAPIGNGPVVRADVTVTFCGLKLGFLNLASREWTGEVVVGDIGAPRAILERFALRA